MGSFAKEGHCWEHLYTQYRNTEGEPVMCLVNTKTKKLAYFDVKSNRFLSKSEASIFRMDVTGIHVIHREEA